MNLLIVLNTVLRLHPVPSASPSDTPKFVKKLANWTFQLEPKNFASLDENRKQILVPVKFAGQTIRKLFLTELSLASLAAARLYELYA